MLKDRKVTYTSSRPLHAGWRAGELLFCISMCFSRLMGAQDVPLQSGSSGQYTYGQFTGQQGAADCEDPLMATSPQCNQRNYGAQQGSAQPVMGQGESRTLPGQPAQVTTFSDVRPLSSAPRTQPRPLQPEPLTEFQKFVALTTQEILPIFGMDLFSNAPSTFAPLDQSPIPQNYVIGPDDEVRVRVWGQINFNANLRVNREGDIFIPQVGSIHVVGLSYADLQQHLREAIARVYKNFDLSVDMGQIRAIQVYVTGAARKPGVYTVSSLSTLINALFVSTGPSVQGSMRGIELRREGKTISKFDFYSLLIRGDKSQDKQLLSGDVIFIPPAGPMAAILGSVHKAAIYELADHDNIGDLIDNAGGITAVASHARVSLERIVSHEARQAMEVSLDSATRSTPLHDGDILRVLSIQPEYSQTVTLRGNVANPGRFAWHDGMRLNDLIPDQASLITRDYWWRRAQLGLPSLDYAPLVALDTTKQPSSEVNLRIRKPAATTRQTPSDRLDAASHSSMSTAAAGIEDTERIRQSEQGSDVQQTALNGTGNDTASGGPTQPETDEEAPIEVKLSVPEIDWSYAVIERMSPQSLKTSLIPFDLGKLVMEHDSSQNLILKAGDVVTVFSQRDIHVPIGEQTVFVRLEGEFAHAGTYSAYPGETLRHLVNRAGGLTSNAYLYGSEFTRRSTQVMQQHRIDESIQELTLQMQRGNLALASSPLSGPQDLLGVGAAEASERELIAQLKLIRATGRIVLQFRPNSVGPQSLPDVTLEDGDAFTVPSRPSTVNVVGSVLNQNSFLYREGGRTDVYLRLAGGPNVYADRKRMFVVRADGAVISRLNVTGGWGDEFERLKMNRGDTLVVPEKSVRPSGWRNVLDISQFASQFAFTAAAINVLR